ncbi:MAG: hypothetical protein ACR2OG_08435 [Gemmatimonadaceae bacterium]
MAQSEDGSGMRESLAGAADRGAAALTGLAPVGSLAAGVFSALAPATPISFGAFQTTPSHPRSRHLKSGDFGLRLPIRLSHISPLHFGQAGGAPAADI